MHCVKETAFIIVYSLPKVLLSDLICWRYCKRDWGTVQWKDSVLVFCW